MNFPNLELLLFLGVAALPAHYKIQNHHGKVNVKNQNPSVYLLNDKPELKDSKQTHKQIIISPHFVFSKVTKSA